MVGGLVSGKESLCAICFYGLRPKQIEWKIGSIHATSLYEYNEAIRSTLYQFKGAKDYELKNAFVIEQSHWLRVRYKGYVLVPAPSSPSHDLERGFNQVEEMFSCLGLPVVRCLKKTKESKQSDLSVEERKRVGKIISMQENGELRGKKVLFVDDVYTTGSTCKACLRLLKTAKPKRIEVLVMAKVSRSP